MPKSYFCNNFAPDIATKKLKNGFINGYFTLTIQFQCLVDGTALALRHAWQKWIEVSQVEESEDEDHGIKIILRCGQGIYCRNNW